MTIITRQTLPLRWAHSILNEEPQGVVILDTETTGYKGDDEVISTAIIDLKGNILLDQVIKPLGRLKKDAQRVNNISEEMVVGAPLFVEVWPQIHAILAEKKVIITYNAEFDARLLRQTAERNGIKVHLRFGANMFAPPDTQYNIKAAWHCLMLQYATFWGEPGRNGGNKWQKLRDACAQQRVSHDNWHHALGDCQAALKLLRALAGKYTVAPEEQGGTRE